MDTNTNTTTPDAFDIVVDGILTAANPDAGEIFNATVQQFVERAGDNPAYALDVMASIVDLIDMAYIEMGGITALVERVEVVRRIQTQCNFVDTVQDDIDTITEG